MVKDPKSVTVLPKFKFPALVNVTFPPVASNSPSESNVPVEIVIVPLISVVPVTVFVVAAIAYVEEASTFKYPEISIVP